MRRNAMAGALLAGALLFASGAARAEERAEERAEDKAGERAPGTPTSVRGWVAGGLGAGSLYGIGFHEAHGTGGLSVDHGHLSVPILLEGDFGKTSAGLATSQVALGAPIQYREGRFRIGAGPEVSYFWLKRAPGASMPAVDAVGLGLCALASFDLVAFDDNRALALLVRGEAMWLRGPDSVFDFTRGTVAPRASVAAGLRF
jgi:hypothetical protein